jgi:signal transduction histidine kinase
MPMAQFSPFLSLLFPDMMKTYRLLLSVILFMVIFTAAHAQDGRIPAPVSVIIDSYQSIRELPQPGWVIKEGDSPLFIQDILNGDIKDGEVLTIDPNDVVIEQYEKYWFALEFISEVDLHNWLLHVENKYTGFGWNNNFSEIRSYTVEEGQLVGSGITGFFIPASERDFKSRDRHTQSLLNLNLGSGNSVTLWVHIKKNFTITSTFPKLTIYDSSVTLPTYILKDPSFVFFSSFLVIWILSLSMYFYLKDRTSLWFVIFLTAALVQNLASWSFDPLTSLLYPENPGYGLYFGLSASVLNVVLCLQFSRVFANLSKNHRKLDKFMLAANWVLFFSGFLLILSIPFERAAFSPVYLAIYGGVYFLSGITYLSLKEPLSRIIGLALLLFIIPQLVPFPFDGATFLPISGLLVTVTIGVGYRIKILFQERLLAEREKKDLFIHQNTLLEKQVADRTSELSHSLTELKSTQSQLVQQEKLASLGQLTAGIAHEIKNPLNFVNNFSEVSMELIEEALEEIAQIEDNEHATESAEILSDIKSNLKKIHEHGTRANTIVTSMLQHSRGGSGKKEPTDVNALIKEYVNLSFHGMRAGKNPINVDIVLDLDPEIKEVSLINEDFTRVIINLCNNAFDALKTVKTQRAASLRVRTKKHGDTITIEIEDNGPGIPDEIKDKILQPFFTTKKGTEGTGLGLSITHDIVKAHGGELTLASNEEVGTQFTIKIPIA